MRSTFSAVRAVFGLPLPVLRFVADLRYAHQYVASTEISFQFFFQ